MKINFYKKINSPINQTIDIYEWFNLIKQSNYSKSISSWRQQDLTKEQWRQLKQELPVVTYNFLFEGKFEKSNIISNTGYIFIDVDDSYDLSNVDFSKVFAYYKSCSGNGFHLICKVIGLTIENFKDTYNFISNDLGICSDKGARKPTQPSYLSYDEDIYINDECLIYQGDIPVLHKQQQDKGGMSPKYKGGMSPSIMSPSIVTKPNWNLSNKQDYSNSESYTFYESGVQVIEINLYRYKNGIKIGERNQTLSILAKKWKLINNEGKISDLMFFLNSVNNKYCNPKLETKELQKIAFDAMNNYQKYNESLTETKKFIFDKNCGLTKEQKQTITNRKMAEEKRKKTLLKLKSNFSKGMTQKKLSQMAGVSERTVKRYWQELNNQDIELSKDIVKHKFKNIEEVLIERSIEDKELFKSVLKQIKNEFGGISEGLIIGYLTKEGWDKYKIDYYYSNWNERQKITK